MLFSWNKIPIWAGPGKGFQDYHGEVRDFMDIHTKKKDKSPTGAKIKIADRGMLKTYYTDEQVQY